MLIKSKLLVTCLILFLLFISCKDKPTDPPPLLTFDDKINELLSKMTLEEKIGQMTQADFAALSSLDDIKNYSLGSLIGGGGSEISDISAAGWADYYDLVQSYALKTRLKIPLIFGIDAVHGHNNVKDAVIFPHNIGLGCSRNPELIKEAARITALEVAGTGMDWTFAPCIAVVRDERWGRTYEGFGETPEIQTMAAEASVIGYQGLNLEGGESILACVKHFVGDGGTSGGDDQGDTKIDETELRAIHLPGYIKAIQSGVGSIMVSYSSWNGKKMHSNKYLINDVLKTELNFEGIVVSDWAGVDQVAPNYKNAVEYSIDSGIDMVMVPSKYKEFIQVLTELVNEGKISIARIDDAVKRILKVKFKLGLFENPFTNRSLTANVGSQQHREIARKCVQESLVLLKNENQVLPISKNINRIHVAGKNADDIGNQCGGWTITWQGSSGNITTGTSILQGIKNTVSSSTQITYSMDGSNASGADLGIVVVGETPYAEMMGDKQNLTLSAEDVNAIVKMKSAGIPVVVILVSGRPMIIEPIINYCDAFVADWLPGTEGQGVADVLFGDFNFKGKLSHTWAKSMSQIPINFGDQNYDPLFPYGFGLTY